MRDSLIFEWPGRHHLHFLLPFTILLAALLHAGLFFVFSIIYPRPENSGPEPAQVYFITPGSDDAARLEMLMHSSDSAVFAPGRGLDLPDPIPRVAYTPQYASDKPSLDALPAPGAAVNVPPLVSGPVPIRETKPESSGTVAEPAPTKIFSSDSLAARTPALPAGTTFQIPLGIDPEPVVFLVAVRGDGRVAHVFPQHGSGNASLDLRAAAMLRALKFAPDPAGEAWGFVTFQWGSDLQQVPAR
ncbi:MAG: hypothetical protein ACOYM3_03190 [Terrimicrobiaceae bacterium]